MISAYSLVMVTGWAFGLYEAVARRVVIHIRPVNGRPGGRLGGEADIVVAVFPLDVGELVFAVLEVAQVLGGIERRGEPGRDAPRSERIVPSSSWSWSSSCWIAWARRDRAGGRLEDLHQDGHDDDQHGDGHEHLDQGHAAAARDGRFLDRVDRFMVGILAPGRTCM